MSEEENSAFKFLGSLIVDRLPPDWDSGCPITRITANEVVMRSPSMLWVAKLIEKREPQEGK